MTTSLTIRIDSELKREAEELFSELGLNLTSAITCFFKKAVASEAIPFSLSRANALKHKRMLKALAEAREASSNPNAERCTDESRLEEFLLK